MATTSNGIGDLTSGVGVELAAVAFRGQEAAVRHYAAAKERTGDDAWTRNLGLVERHRNGRLLVRGVFAGHYVYVDENDHVSQTGAAEGGVAGGLAGALLGPPGLAIGLTLGGVIGALGGHPTDTELEPDALIARLREIVPPSSSAIVTIAPQPDVEMLLAAVTDDSASVVRRSLTAHEQAALEASLTAGQTRDEPELQLDAQAQELTSSVGPLAGRDHTLRATGAHPSSREIQSGDSTSKLRPRSRRSHKWPGGRLSPSTKTTNRINPLSSVINRVRSAEMDRETNYGTAVFWGIVAAGVAVAGVLVALLAGYLLGDFTHVRTKTVALRTITRTVAGTGSASGAGQLNIAKPATLSSVAPSLRSIGAGVEGPQALSAAIWGQGPKESGDIAEGPNGAVFVSTAGETGKPVDGVYVVTKGATPVKVVSGLVGVLGVAWHQNRLFVSSFGRVDVYGGFTGTSFRTHQTLLKGLPGGKEGWNDDLRIGPDGRFYMAIGSGCDHCAPTKPLTATIVSFLPNGSDLKVFASGIRGNTLTRVRPRNRRALHDHQPAQRSGWEDPA